MNTYFIHGIECALAIGQKEWQKAISQKLLINIEWQLNDQHISTNTNDYELIIKHIIDLAASQHWLSLSDLAEQIKILAKSQFSTDSFQITLTIPHADANCKSVGITITHP